MAGVLQNLGGSIQGVITSSSSLDQATWTSSISSSSTLALTGAEVLRIQAQNVTDPWPCCTLTKVVSRYR